MTKMVVIWGTRPEAIKLGPVVAELRGLGVEPALVSTGQHTSLLAGTPAEADLADSESLGIASAGDINEWFKAANGPMRRALERLQPDVVVVQGDTMSAALGTLHAKLLGIPIVHIEAGLRSHSANEPYPEEQFRVFIARWAQWHLAPTETARDNLLAEGVQPERIRVTGNPIVSAIARYANAASGDLIWRQVLITMHRREWLEQGSVHVERTLLSFAETAAAHPTVAFLWPMHPAVAKYASLKPSEIPANLQFCQPFPYHDAIRTLSTSLGVATDSGGLQEEAGILGVPCAVLRNVTDRPESIREGVAKLFPPTPEGVFSAIECLVRQELPRRPLTCYGNRDSASRIAQFLAKL